MAWFAEFSSVSGRRENRLKLSVLNTVARLLEQARSVIASSESEL